MPLIAGRKMRVSGWALHETDSLDSTLDSHATLPLLPSTCYTDITTGNEPDPEP